MAGTGFVYDVRFLEHLTGPGHPERPERLTAIHDIISGTNLNQKLIFIDPEPADTDWLLRVHPPEYINYLEKSSQQCESFSFLDNDTIICPRSFEIAGLAAGAIVNAIDAVLNSEIDNCFCAVRPPGHHAGRQTSMGFCLINNAAVGAEYLRGRHGLGRIAIIDWDVHHGNGTQEIFYSDPGIFYTSIHQYPFYPGTGAANDTGSGAGKGATLNIPLRAGSGDENYLEALQSRIIPALENWRPEFIIISSGFDAHMEDPLAGMNVTDEGYYQMTMMVRELADNYCGGKIVSVLEGGYNLGALSRSVKRHLEGLME